MAKIDTDQDFGIEKTMSTDTAGVGNQDLLNDLFAPETSTADPNDVTAIEKKEEPSNQKGADGKANPTALAGKDDNVPENAAKDPDALANFLLGDGDDEGDGEGDEGKPVDTPPATLTPEQQAAADAEAAEAAKANENKDNNDGIIAFDSLANELADLGVFNRMEGEEEGIPIETPEDFLERFNLEKQRGAQQMISDFIGQFGQEHQEAFDAIYVKGVNPRDYFSKSAEIEDFANMDLTKEQNQERVIRQTLTDQGFESEDIEVEIQKIKDYGDLEDVSKRHHKVLVKKEKQALKQQEATAQQELEFKQAQKDEYVNNVRAVLTEKLKAKEFDGIPLNPAVANELQDFLLVDKWKTPTGETLTDFDRHILELKKPENHATKVKLGLLLKLLEKDPTLSTIQKSGVSKKSSQLFRDVARQKTTAKRAVDNKQPTIKSWFQ